MNDQAVLEFIHAFGMAATALAYLLGVVFFLIAAMKLRTVGQPASGGRASTPSGVVYTLLASVLLVYLGATINVMHDTAFVSDWSFNARGVDQPTAWTSKVTSTHDAMAIKGKILYDLFRLIGLIGIIKGILTLRVLEHARAGDGTVAKLFGYIGGGLAMYYIDKTVFAVAELVPVVGKLNDVFMAGTI